MSAIGGNQNERSFLRQKSSRSDALERQARSSPVLRSSISASEQIRKTMSLADCSISTRSMASPTMTAATSVSPASRASAYFGCSTEALRRSPTRSRLHRSVKEFFNVLIVHCAGQSMPLAMSTAELRTVSSPDAKKAARFMFGCERASLLAKNAVPHSTPAAPSIKAAARPRPSAMPPAAMTGMFPTASTTAGISGNVDRVPPCPPASVPCATMNCAPSLTAAFAWATV